MTSTKLALMARAEDTGIGNQSHEFYRHMHPDKVLVVNMTGVTRRTTTTHPEWYPDATVVPFDGHVLDETVCRRWLEGLRGGVVFSVETTYNFDFCDWARDAGVRTAIQLNPEFYKHPDNPSWPHPDAWWLPTVWRREHMPAESRIVPVPVALDRFPDRRPRPLGDPVRFLHVVGRQAWGDRAGTTTLLRALRHANADINLTIITQDHRLSVPRSNRRNVKLSLIVRSKLPYWELYGRGDVLVQPRRYGGLSLPLGEAAAAGLALVMPDTVPHPQTWPGVHVKAHPHRTVLNSGNGPIPVYDAEPTALAAVIDNLATHPERVRELSYASQMWADAHSWDRLAPLYRDELERVCAMPARETA